MKLDFQIYDLSLTHSFYFSVNEKWDGEIFKTTFDNIAVNFHKGYFDFQTRKYT
jgi:hypothetical protein